MSIPDAMHLLHLPANSPVTTTCLRQALENALERAKFDEIPILLAAYRTLEGHLGGPEGSATRQDDPTGASWPATTAPTGSRVVELDPWEDDPSITVSDIRMIEPASIAAPGVGATNSSLQTLGGKSELGKDSGRIVIDDFSLDQFNTQAVNAPRMATVVKMQPLSGGRTRTRRISVPTVLATGIASLLVVWAYHPFTQGLVSGLFGQPPPPTQSVVAKPILATDAPLANTTVTASSAALRPADGSAVSESRSIESRSIESRSSVVSSKPIILQARDLPKFQPSTVNDQLTFSEPNPSEPNVKAQNPKPIASQSASSKVSLSQPVLRPVPGKPVPGKPVPGKPVPGKPGLSPVSVRITAKAMSAKAMLPKVVPARTARKGNPQPKSSVIAARQPPAPAFRSVRATAGKPAARSTVIGSQTAKKAIQTVKNTVSRVPRAAVSRPLRVSKQADAGRTTTSDTNAGSTKPKSTSQKSTSQKSTSYLNASITNPIKLVSSNERDAAAERAIANPQPVASIQRSKASGRIDNLSREEFGQRYFNRKLFEVWQRDGAKLRYGSWNEVPLELQILENNLFRSAIYLNGPGGNEAKDNEKPLQP